MAKDLYAAHAQVRDIFDRAENILGFPLKQLCFEGPDDQLRQTVYTQPAIFTHSIAVTALLRQKGLTPLAVAGHSLGEYSALVSAGALGFEDGLRLVMLRGELMQHSGEKNPGTMAAVIGADNKTVEEACKKATAEGIVQPANYNCPGQLVISGSIPGVHRAMALAKEKGARMVKELVVSGAFHSPLMADALAGLEAALDSVDMKDPDVPVYSNVEARPVTDATHIRELLKQQLMAPVRWESIMRNLIADGYGPFYEVGPGKVLAGLLKRTDREQVCTTLGTATELENMVIQA